jgi:bacterioferritin
MSDVTRYFYIAVVTKQQFSSITTCFHHISIVEMHHLNIFAELALLLGAATQALVVAPRLSVTRTRCTWIRLAYQEDT